MEVVVGEAGGGAGRGGAKEWWEEGREQRGIRLIKGLGEVREVRSGEDCT